MRTSTILISLLLFTSCSKENLSTVQSTPSENKDKISYSTPEINFKRALSIAENATSMFGNTTTKAVTKRVLNSEIVSGGMATKSSDIDTLMYVFNYAEGGYIVVPTVDIEGQVIAYVEEGYFDIKDTIDNELSRFIVRLMMNSQEKVKAKYKQSKTASKGITPPIEENIPVGPACHLTEYKEDYGTPVPAPPLANEMGLDYYIEYGCSRPHNSTTYTISDMRLPLMTTCWNQLAPYNDKAPMENGKRTYAGCVAVAVAQIMAYNNHPTNYPVLTNPNISVFSGSLTKLSLLRDYKYIKETSSAGARNYVSILLKVTGYLLNNFWGLDGTGALSDDVPEVLYKMGYEKPQLTNYDADVIRRSLYYSRPVYIRGTSIDPGTAHAWVLDGDRTVFWKSVRYTDFFDSNGDYNGRSDVSNFNTEQYFFHCNFGWGGKGNGYYDDGIFDTNNPLELTGSQTSNGNYQVDLKIIANIKKR